MYIYINIYMVLCLKMYTQMELLVTIIILRTRCLFPAITPNTFNLFDGDIVQAMDNGGGGGAVMHVGNAKPRWRGKRSRRSRHCQTRNFKYLARGSYCVLCSCLICSIATKIHLSQHAVYVITFKIFIMCHVHKSKVKWLCIFGVYCISS